MPLERKPQVMSCPCSGALAARSPGFSSYFGVFRLLFSMLTQGMFSVYRDRSDPKHCLVVVKYEMPHERRSQVMSCPGNCALAARCPYFSSYFLFFQAAIRCLHKGCSPFTGYRNDPKHRLVVVEYEISLERRPQVMSCPCSSVLAACSPSFSSYFGVFRLLFSVLTQGCSRSRSPREDQSVHPVTEYEMPPHPRPTPCPVCGALLMHGVPPAFLPILAVQLCSCYSLCTQGCPGPVGVRHVARVGRC